MTFGEGEYRIGVDIPPGRYRAVGYSDTCTWRLVEELSRSITEPGQNVGYAGPNFPITVVDLTHPRALTFSSTGCGTWTTDLTPLVLPGEPFGDGTFLVGAELAPGRYRASASPDTCRWFLWDARIDGGGAGFGDFIGNRTIVDILPDDAGFTSHGCGTWSPQRARTTVTPGRPFGDGTFLVGPEIAPGRYRTTTATDECQWERLHHFRGQSEIVFWTGSVLAFDGWATGTLVDIDAADVGFHSRGCGIWSNDLSPIVKPGERFGDGAYLVGPEVAPGRYRADGTPASCWWERTSGFGGYDGSMRETIEHGDQKMVVQIEPSDTGFVTSGCGTWQPVE